MKVVWICGLPEDVRLNGYECVLSDVPCATWSWIMGHLPPPPHVDLHIICPVIDLIRERVDFEYNGVSWHCVLQRRKEVLFFWRRVFREVRAVVREIEPDVIHGWGAESGFGYLAMLLSHCAFVGVQGELRLFDDLVPGFSKRHHTSPFNYLAGTLQRFIEAKAYKKAFRCLVESDLARDGLMRYYGVKSIVIPHPLRTEFCKDSRGARCELAKKPLVFLFLGALETRKGALDAYRAFRRAQIPGARMVYIGDGELRADLEGVVELNSHATPAEIVALMKAAHFYVLPSYGDTGPTSLKEAIAQGLYPICYNNSGPHELLTRYQVGTLVATGDIEGLANAMSEAAKNVDRCIANGLDAAARISADLGHDQVWDKLLQAYNMKERK